MRRLLLIAKRDYLASVRTKAFLIGLLIAPLLFGGSLAASFLLRGQSNKETRKIAIVANGSESATAIAAQLRERAQREADGRHASPQQPPRYEFEIVSAGGNHPDAQRLALSNRVRGKDLLGFLEIQGDSVDWYSNEGGFGETARWLDGPINDAFRRMRLSHAGVGPKQADQVLTPVPLDTMGLVERDRKSGQILPAHKRGIAEGFAAPFAIGMFFFMIVLLASAPMLSAVAEDKAQRVFEMLLASASPLDLIGGKVLAAVATALTSSVFYVIGALVLLNALAVLGLAPLKVMPWFFIYLVAEVTMLASVATALGAACSSGRDAENLKMVIIMPVMIPIFVLTPVLQDPNGPLATSMSLFPLFTPLLMLVRQASPAGVPWWQPWVGLSGVIILTVALSWFASRVFRVGLLAQGKTPNLKQVIRWGVAG